MTFGVGFSASVAFANGRGYLTYRAGNPALSGSVLVWEWDGEDIQQARLIRTFHLPPESPAFPRLHTVDGTLWLGYHDGSVGHLRNLTSNSLDVLEPCQNNHPICFGAEFVAWQGAAFEGWPILRLNLRNGELAPAGFGQGSGLSRVLGNGTVRTMDADRFLMAGATCPAFAGDVVVGEGPARGVLYNVGAHRGVLWPALELFLPSVAVDGERVAIAAAGPAAGVQLWCGTRADLLADVPPVDPPPVEPPSMPDIPNQFAVVERVRARFPTPLGVTHPQCLTDICVEINAGLAADVLAAHGPAGLFRKEDDNSVTLPNGVRVSKDIIIFQRSGRVYDCLVDSEGVAAPAWGPAGPTGIEPNPASKFVPVGDVPVPPDPPDPPDPPPPGSVTLEDIYAEVLALRVRFDQHFR